MSFLDNLYNTNEPQNNGLPWGNGNLSNPIDTIRKAKEQEQEAARQEAEKLAQPTRLHAPYNVVVEPTRDKNNKTQTGGDYDQAMKKFKELTAQNDLTQEAADIRQAWSTPPRVSIENGQIKLSGTQQFLNSDTAKQLREVFAEMKGQTYNTEVLDKQIEAWNSDLEQMGKSYIEALDGLNAMNYSIYTTHKNPTVTMLTFEDYLRIVNNAAIGRDKDALTSDKLIFMGYEWNEDGTKTPIYKKASEFVADVAALKGPKGHSKDLVEAWNNRSADYLKSGQSIYWNELAAQAAEGDVSAIAKMAFLQGDSEAAPANVIIPDQYRFNDFVASTMMTTANILTAGIDAATAWFNPITGLPRLIGNFSNVAQSGDWNDFWKSDAVSKQTKEFTEVNSWYLAYNSQLMPGTTAVAAGIGTAAGMAGAIGLNIVSASIAQEMIAQGAHKALTAAGAWLETSGKGVRISMTVGGVAGKQQQLVTMNGSMAQAVGTGLAKGATAGTMELSVVLPKFVVENLPGVAKAIAEADFSIQAAMQGVNLAGKAGSDLGIFVAKGNDAFAKLFGTTSTLPAVLGSTGNTAWVLGKTGLDSMRMWSNGFRVGMNLYLAGNYSAIRHIDSYLRRQYNGEDVGDMGSYVGLGVARDVAVAAALGAVTGLYSHFKQISQSSKIAPTRLVDTVNATANNTASGFYTEEPLFYEQPKTAWETAGGTEKEYTELTTLFSSIMSGNGERFFVPNNPADAMIIPGTENAGAAIGTVNAIGTIKDSVLKRSTIVPAVDGFNVVTMTRNLTTGEEVTDVKFFNSFDEANSELQESNVPIVNPNTMRNSDVAVSADVAPFTFGDKDHGALAAIKTLPDGTSRVKVDPGIAYYNPDEFTKRLDSVIKDMPDEAREGFYATQLDQYTDKDLLIKLGEGFADGKMFAAEYYLAPDFSTVPQTRDEGIEFGNRVRLALAYIKYMQSIGKNNVLIPTKIPSNSIETVKRRRMVYDRTYLGTELNNGYREYEHNPVALGYDTQTGDKNHWWYDSPMGPMAYALGGSYENSFKGQQNSYTIVIENGGFRAAAKNKSERKDFDDIVALAAMLYIYGSDGPYVWPPATPTAEGDTDEFGNGFFWETAAHGFGPGDPYRKMDLAKEAISNGTISPKTIKSAIEEQKSHTHDKPVLKRLDEYEKFLVKVLPRAKKWLNEYSNDDAGLSVINPAVNLLTRARGLYKDALRAGVAKMLKTKGVQIATPIVVPAEVDRKAGIAVFSPDRLSLAQRLSVGRHEDNEMYVHLPKGTVVYRYFNNGDYEWLADISHGGYIAKPKHAEDGSLESPHFYANDQNGKRRKPKTLEYDPTSYMLYDSSWDEDFDGENYYNMGTKLLSPTNAVPGAHDSDYRMSHGGWDMYTLTEPAGIVNGVNRALRAVGLKEDSLKLRFELFESGFWPQYDHYKNSYWGDDYNTGAGIIRLLKNALYDNSWAAFDVPGFEDYHDIGALTNGSPYDNASTQIKMARHGKDTPESKFKEEFEDIVRNDIHGYLESVGEEISAEERLIGATHSDTQLPQSVVEKFLSDVKTLVEKYSDQFPHGYSTIMEGVAKYGHRGSHKVTGAPIVFFNRGANGKGNGISTVMSNYPFANKKPGDRIVSNDFMFTSMNALTPFAYAQNYEGDGHQYILTIGVPKGGEVYYFGDEPTDTSFNRRRHHADGGAVVIPYNTGMTVVSRVELSPDITWLTLITDDAKGKPYSGPLNKRITTLGILDTKSRKTIDVKNIKPNKYIVTEAGIPKESFSDIKEAIAWRDAGGSGVRQIYELDDNAPTMDRPPVTMENVYTPTLRSDSAKGIMPIEQPEGAPDITVQMEKFNNLMLAMPLLKDSPTDYAQGILDIARIVQEVYDSIAATVDMPAIYEEYARQIAEGVEQPTVDDETKEKLAPLTEILNALGRYFDPSGKSLTQEFYLPTGAPSKKLASIEDAILHPDRAVDVEHPVDTSFDDIMVDPLRVGDSGFWEKRTGELFRDEDGNFTMAKAGTLEENLIAYTVAALTRGEYALSVAANNEVAYSKPDRNRNQITVSEALKGLRAADKNRAKIRASQIKAANSYSRREKKAKLEELKNEYSDKNTIKAIEEAYGERNFAKEINYTRTLNKNARTLGYRRTLNISPIKGSALRFGNNNGFKGIANDIRKASHINVTGTKWVTRYGEKVCVAFGLSPAQMEQTEATRSEDAINLGNSAMLLFQPERAAGMFYKQILRASEKWATQGGFELINAIKDFARSNFPALSNPEVAADKLFQSMVSNFNAYNDETALWLANQETITEWIKKYAAVHINSIIQMADIDVLDERTIDAIDQIMTKAMVGTAVYNSKIVSALQRSTYAATLWVNPSPMVGNLLSEPERGIDFFGYKVFAKAMIKFLSPKARAQARNELGDLESYLKNEPELVGLAKTVKNKLQMALDSFEDKAMSPLQKSENQKNLLFWLMAKENAARMYPKDKSAQLQNALRTFNDVAIAGGPGTTPSVASSNIGRLLFVLKTFSLRNWDDFIEMTEQIGHGSSGSYKWDKGLGRRAQGGYGGGKEKFDYKKAGRFMGGTLLRRYLLWLFVLGPLGRSIWDALGGDPTGLTENFSRGLYDDESTEEYEGMTPLDNLINMLPTGFIFGMLKDFYFAARRSGVETGNFLGPIDIERDAALQKDLRNHLPLGVMNRRIGDMMELLDRGYSFNSYGNKTYAAPQNILDIIKGFALGKNTTSNAMAYNKYRYGSVDIWGDLFEGDWLDFAMSANPFADDLGLVKFDSTRKDYNGVFRGSYNDVPTMQAAIADLRNRRGTIVQEYNQDLERYTGPFQGLNDQQRKDLAAKRREAKINTFTEDVQRLVDAYTKAGNALSDSQVNTLMYLFDFNEGDEDTYDSQVARQRYVEAGLPDVNPAIQPAKQDSDTGEITEPNYFQRSLIYQNAVQGRYGVPREAAKAVDEVLSNFKSTYKSYKEKVTNLNNKAYAAAKNSKERKNLQAEVEKLQEEYLNQLYSALTPVVNKYGTEVLSSNAVVESLQPYMSSMIPYSTIKKYGLTYSSGNDIVWGQLSDWIKGRWGAGSPTVGSDPEITAGIKTIKTLLDEGKTAQAKSQARTLLERVARGSLSARHDDVVELRRIINE